MSSSFSGKSIALVVCSGFEEQPFVTLQRHLTEAGAIVKVVSRDNGVTNGWSGENWGMSYPVDAALADTIEMEANRVTAPADADLNEMIDKFDLAMRNSSNEDKAA